MKKKRERNKSCKERKKKGNDRKRNPKWESEWRTANGEVDQWRDRDRDEKRKKQRDGDRDEERK